MTSRLIIFFFVWIGLFYNNISAQQTVFKTYYSIDSSDNNPAPFAVELSSSYIYASVYSGLYGSFGLGLRKISKEGQPILFKLLYPSDSFDVIVNSIKLIEPNKILITGTNFWRKNRQFYTYLLLIDTNLNVLAEKNDSFDGYTNEIFRGLFYDYEGNLCTMHDEFTYSTNPDSMYLSIRKINLSDLSTTKIKTIQGYFSEHIIKTTDSGYLLYSFSPLYEKKYYYDPIMLKFDKNWNKLWERNIGDYGKLESGGYGITRMVELNSQYYCWRTSQEIDEVGFLFKLDKDGTILNKWKEKDSSWFQTLINRGNDVIAFGNMNYYYKGDWRIALHIFDSNYNILKQNYIGFREFYDTCATPIDSTLYHMDAIKTMDGGFLIFNSGSSYGAIGKVDPFGKNFDILFKTDSCGYTQGDTCKLVARIDSIRYRTVYLSIDEYNFKVCGRRWYVDGKVYTSEKLTYSFSDTGTYTIGIWGFAGATTDSTSIQVHIAQLDSCHSRKTDTCTVLGDTTYLKCNQIRFTLDNSSSHYCTRYWLIEGIMYDQDEVSYTYPINNTYTAYLIGSRGISSDTSKFKVKIDCKTNIINNQESQIDIYPNPASDYIHLSTYPIKNHSLQVYIYDLLGREILRENLNKSDTMIAVSSLDKGNYILVLKDSKGDIINRVKLSIQR